MRLSATAASSSRHAFAKILLISYTEVNRDKAYLSMLNERMSVAFNRLM